MIEASPKWWAEAVFRRILRRAFRRSFACVAVRGLGNIADAAGPVLACPNHTNWWDGFVCAFVAQHLRGRRQYLAQDEQHLSRYRFFRHVGAFGLDLRGSPRAGLRHALRLLRERESLVWFFPQGELVPAREPLRVKAGAVFLANRSGAALVPVWIRYEWFGESRPAVVVSIGKPLRPPVTSGDLQDAMNALGDEPVSKASLAGCRLLMPPRMSLNRRWDFMLHLLRGGKREDFRRWN